MDGTAVDVHHNIITVLLILMYHIDFLSAQKRAFRAAKMPPGGSGSQAAFCSLANRS